jgi:trimethylamine-N-oxide reductase cytochrome c-type subunit TorC
LLALGALVGAAAMVAAAEMVRQTSTDEFCTGACHSMQWAGESYKRSVHYSNSLGLRAACADCHIPHHTGHADLLNYIKLMIFKAKIGVSDAVAEIQGVISTREKWEQERPRLSKEFEQWVKDTHSITCQNCHDLKAFGGDYSEMTKMVHADLLHANTVNCLKCHQHVGHVYDKGSTADTPDAATAEPLPEPSPRR